MVNDVGPLGGYLVATGGATYLVADVKSRDGVRRRLLVVLLVGGPSTRTIVIGGRQVVHGYGGSAMVEQRHRAPRRMVTLEGLVCYLLLSKNTDCSGEQVTYGNIGLVSFGGGTHELLLLRGGRSGVWR